ncbi:MAG: hypothetical protein V7K48_15960 [Nostoc sp.]
MTNSILEIVATRIKPTFVGLFFILYKMLCDRRSRKVTKRSLHQFTAST